MSSIRVAIAGVGNCAASLVQGVHFYRDADPSETVPGLMHVRFGDYHVAKDIGWALTGTPVATRSNTPRPPAKPIAIDPMRAPTTMAPSRMMRWTTSITARSFG